MPVELTPGTVVRVLKGMGQRGPHAKRAKEWRVLSTQRHTAFASGLRVDLLPTDPVIAARWKHPLQLDSELVQVIQLGAEWTDIACTECEKIERVIEYRGARQLSPGWFFIDEVGDAGGVYCGRPCVDKHRDEEERILESMR